MFFLTTMSKMHISEQTAEGAAADYGTQSYLPQQLSSGVLSS
jgi:hypothetical protein